MTKQQEYFEKNVAPFRQRIRELESDNNQLLRDKTIIDIKVESLECENEKLQREIESLMKFASLTQEEKKRVLEQSEIFGRLGTMFSSVSKAYR